MEQRDVDPGVGIAAARAITDRDDPAFAATLEDSAARDPDPAVRSAAASSYERLWPWGKSPRAATGLSLLCPGCGQIYLRETGEGAALLATTVGLLAGGIVLIHGHTVSLDGTSDWRAVPIGLWMALAGQNLWFYSIFDAYRDARVLRGDAGYRYAITRESLPDLASAPFRPSVLASPWVWAGVPLALGAGIAASYLADRSATSNPSIFDVKNVNVLGHTFHRGPGLAAGEGYFAALFAPVGVGEEVLFRGLILTEFEELLVTYGGLAAA